MPRSGTPIAPAAVRTSALTSALEFALAFALAFALLVPVALVTAGCNRSAQGGCQVDDDCRAFACNAGELAVCSKDDGACACRADQFAGDVGRFASMQVRAGVAYVCAYNSTYGDLMVGHQAPPGVVASWEFVDGVPDVAPDNPRSQVRGGVTDPGDDVGRYCSLALAPGGDPVMAYHDGTHKALKLASFGAVRWRAQVVDAAGDDVGRYAALTLDKAGVPAIAYHAEVAKGQSGMRESQLRWAQASRPDPQGPADWKVTVLLAQPIAAPDPMAAPTVPDGIGLFVAATRKPDDSPALAFYDHQRGNLVYLEASGATQSASWSAPVILDGEDGAGNDTGDVGWYPSLAVDEQGVAHLAYADATRGALRYINTAARRPEIADDGYRSMDEQTLDGLAAPVRHLVGDSSSLQLSGGAILVAYQDATNLTLRVARRDAMTGAWKSERLAGHGTPFAGSYGFYAQARVTGGQAVLSSYAINQHLPESAFFVEVFGMTVSELIQ